MFKWTIVQEAKRKKKDDKDTEINEDEVAKKDEEEADDLEETDYTEDEVDLDNEDLEDDETSINEDEVAQDVDGDGIPDDEEGTDYTEDEEGDLEETDYNEDESSGDDMSDDTSTSDEITGDEEVTDYTEDETSTDGMSDDTTPTNTGNPNDIRNASLIYDYIQLYNTIKSIITKVNSMNKTDILRNKTIIQVSKNLNILLNTLHKYIIKSFDKNSYVFNLYQFNLFIHAINVNIEMIKKNNELVSKG